MTHGPDSIALVLGMVMLLLGLAIPCQPGLARAARLASLQSLALAGAVALRALAGGGAPMLALAMLILLGLILLGKVILLPRLLAAVPDRPVGRALPILALGAAFALLGWIALPPHAARPADITLAFAMLPAALVPAILGQSAPRRLLGLLAAENGLLLAALRLPDPMHPLVLELAATSLLAALLLAARHDPGAPRAAPAGDAAP